MDEAPSPAEMIDLRDRVMTVPGASLSGRTI